MVLEEVQQMQVEEAFLGGMTAGPATAENEGDAGRQQAPVDAVPACCAAFLQRLVAVESTSERCGVCGGGMCGVVRRGVAF